MEKTTKLLSDITIFGKYAKYLPNLKRRETWDEICDRYEQMMIKKYPKLEDNISRNMLLVRDKKVLPSMRALQFAGKPIELSNSRIYNCAFLPIDDYHAFSETMFLLLGGTGVGYSVQKQHVVNLPAINPHSETIKFVIQDSIIGWSDAIKALVKGYFGLSPLPDFVYDDIRQQGERLKTSGGKAPGPNGLRNCLEKIETILKSKAKGSRLQPIECHDIQCHIADAVLAGGIRRAAMISLFSYTDEDMLKCKSGNWWEQNAQRGRANNSVVINRNKILKTEWVQLWKIVEESNAGEPGVYLTNNEDWGTNPCCEIALRAYQFCNLTEVNVSDVISQADLNQRVTAATFFGTLQAGYTDFHYLRRIWKETTEKDALTGIGMTGIGSGKILNYNLEQAADLAKRVNEDIANFIGINPAARVTTIKPSGTTSCVLGTSSGIHAWHNSFYIRRQRVTKLEPLYGYFVDNFPNLVEDDVFTPNQAVISIPQKAPEGSILRTESAIDLLERVNKFSLEWVKKGHRNGDNTNNVSATISIKPEEWESCVEWMWNHKDNYNGLSVLPYDNGSYVQAPFEDIQEDKFNELVKGLGSIDLSSIVEDDDLTKIQQEAACAGGACEVSY